MDLVTDVQALKKLNMDKDKDYSVRKTSGRPGAVLRGQQSYHSWTKNQALVLRQCGGDS